MKVNGEDYPFILWKKQSRMKYVSGWWLSHPSEKYDFVSWDHCSQYMEKKIHVPNHQIYSISITNFSVRYFEHLLFHLFWIRIIHLLSMSSVKSQKMSPKSGRKSQIRRFVPLLMYFC